MKKFNVVFHRDAIADINDSFEWGVEFWGKEKAIKWARKLYAACRERLSIFPESCPVAPETEDIEIEIRQLVIDRYRVLFIIENNTVEIIHVRGPYIGGAQDP
jgi:plasmid stabilization system protein ParE